jgi:hypothetical protein
MAADQHETLIRAYIDDVFNGHRVDSLEKYWDDDLTSHWLGMETIQGLPAWREASLLRPNESNQDELECETRLLITVIVIESSQELRQLANLQSRVMFNARAGPKSSF